MGGQRREYGALSAPEGELTVRWRVDPQGTTIDWTEKGGTDDRDQPRPQLGTKLIEATVQQLHGKLGGSQGEGVLRRRLELSGLVGPPPG